MGVSRHTMVKSVFVQDFKCLASVQMDLEPLTVLIGKNDTGKTSFLEAIGYSASAQLRRQRVPVGTPELVRRGPGPKSCTIKSVTTDGRTFQVSFLGTAFSID